MKKEAIKHSSFDLSVSFLLFLGINKDEVVVESNFLIYLTLHFSLCLINIVGSFFDEVEYLIWS